MKARIVKQGRKYAAAEFLGIGWALIGKWDGKKAETRTFSSVKKAKEWLVENGYEVEEEW